MGHAISYLRVETREKITKNSYVLLCKEDSFLQRAKSEGECEDGHKPLLKSVVAEVGDVVTISDEGIFVNYRKLKNSEPELCFILYHCVYLYSRVFTKIKRISFQYTLMIYQRNLILITI